MIGPLMIHDTVAGFTKQFDCRMQGKAASTVIGAPIVHRNLTSVTMATSARTGSRRGRGTGGPWLALSGAWPTEPGNSTRTKQ